MKTYRKNPERFVHGASIVKLPPKEVWINKPNLKEQPENVSLITNCLIYVAKLRADFEKVKKP